MARFGDATELPLREQVAMALVNKGVTLGHLDRSDGGDRVYDELVARFGDAPEPAVREQVAMALIGKGVMLGQLDPRGGSPSTTTWSAGSVTPPSSPCANRSPGAVDKGVTLGPLEPQRRRDRRLRRWWPVR